MHDVPFIRTVTLLRERIAVPDEYPFCLPALRRLKALELSRTTFFVGENGTGKSTLLEGIAIACGFNPEGGTKNFNFATRRTESELHRFLRIARMRPPQGGFFLRAESFYNVATEIDRLGVGGYGDKSLHEQSHGESFLSLVKHRFGPRSLFILDEPEAALSPARQLALLVRMNELVREDCQFVIATHSPILMAFPAARIYSFTEDGIDPVAYEDTEHVRLTRDFLADPKRFLNRLLSDDRG